MRKTITVNEEKFEEERKRLLGLINDFEEQMNTQNQEVRQVNIINNNLKTTNEELKREIEVLKGYTSSGVKGASQYEMELEITSLKTELELRNKKIEDLNLAVSKEKNGNLKAVEEVKVS